MTLTRRSLVEWPYLIDERQLAATARASILSNPVVTTASGTSVPIALLSDGTTLVLRASNSIDLCVSINRGVAVTTGHRFDSAGWGIEGFLETPGGEALVSTRKADNTVPGFLYRSTGWNKLTADATSWAVVKTFSANGAYAYGPWDLHNGCVAPPWSPHTGTIFVCEYGLPKPNAYQAYMSVNDGVTWTSIFDLTSWAGADTDTHCHSVTYDPWTGRVYVAFGDTTHGIVYSDDVTAVTPTWTLVPGSDGTVAAGTKQVTSMRAYEAGLLLLSDGRPLDIRFLPRVVGGTGIGPIRERAAFSGGTATYIGRTIWRNGELGTPLPDSPVFLCSSEPASQYSRPVIFASFDGGQTIVEAYRHATGIAAPGQTGIERVFGPMTDGKVVATINVDGTTKVLTLDF